MKKSAKITLTVVAAAGLAGCGRRRIDPCDAAYFNQQACLEAVDRGGYYWQGSWFPMSYRPYPYYFDSYRTYVSHGGHASPAPVTSYVGSGSGSGHSTGSSASSPSSSSVTRGGFGSTGAGHGAGS